MPLTSDFLRVIFFEDVGIKDDAITVQLFGQRDSIILLRYHKVVLK